MASVFGEVLTGMVGFGIILTWVLVSSLPFITSEIVHSFKMDQILGIKTTKSALRK